MNFKQLAFVKYYTSDDPETGGNATKSYKAAYGSTCSERSIQAMGSKMLRHPLVKDRLARAEAKAVREIDWNAKRVLQESVRLYDRCMGEEDYLVAYSRTDPKTGETMPDQYATRSFNASGARAALELIGRNTTIAAFSEQIEVSHTHYLEQALAKRGKLIEGRAQVLADPGARPALPAPGDQAGDQAPTDPDQATPAPAPAKARHVPIPRKFKKDIAGRVYSGKQTQKYERPEVKPNGNPA